MHECVWDTCVIVLGGCNKGLWHLNIFSWRLVHLYTKQTVLFVTSRRNFVTMPCYIVLPPSAIESICMTSYGPCRRTPITLQQRSVTTGCVPVTYITCGEGRHQPAFTLLHPRILSNSIMGWRRQTAQYTPLECKKDLRHVLYILLGFLCRLWHPLSFKCVTRYSWRVIFSDMCLLRFTEL